MNFIIRRNFMSRLILFRHDKQKNYEPDEEYSIDEDEIEEDEDENEQNLYILKGGQRNVIF